MYGADEVYTEYKLNSAYAVGGPKCLVKVIQKLSGLSVNRFMAVDFAGFSKMVDALGGVEVCSTTPLEDYELGTVLPNAGRQMVDGHTALQYVRARQVVTETNGDYGRIKRQQLFLSSLLRSMISKEVFFSLSKLNNVVNMFINDSYVDNMDTKDLVTLGQSIQGIAAGRITFLTVPTTGYMDEYGNEHMRDEDNRAIFDAIINDDPLPEEKNADNTPVPGTPESSVSAAPDSASESPSHDAAPSSELVDAITTNPQDITVQVSNSTGEDGLGATAASELQQHGFNVTTPDDYPGSLTSTTVLFSPGNEQAAATVASSFANPTIERVSGMGDTVKVVLGTDFYTVTRAVTERVCRAGPRRSRLRQQQHSDAAARGPGGHQRGRHDLRIAATTLAVVSAQAGVIHLSFTIHVVTFRLLQTVGWTYANRVPRAIGPAN